MVGVKPKWAELTEIRFCKKIESVKSFAGSLGNLFVRSFGDFCKLLIYKGK